MTIHPTPIPQQLPGPPRYDVAGLAQGAPPYEPVFGTRGGGDSSRTGTTRRDIARVLFKHKYTILACALITTAVVAAGLVLLPPVYTSGAKILFRADQQGDPAFFSGVAALREPRTMETSGRRLETEMALFEALPLSSEVVTKLGLTYDQVYHSPRRLLLAPLIGAYDWIRESWFGASPKNRHDLGATVRDFRAGLDVRPADPKSPAATSDVVVVTLRAPDPVVAQRALKEMLAAHMRLEAKMNEEAGRTALVIVESETSRASDDLLLAEQRLRDFLSTEGVQVGSSARNLTTTPGDESTIAQLRSRLVDLEIKLLEARRTYREDSEQVQSLLRQVDDLRNRVDEELAGSASNSSREKQLRRDVLEAETRHSELLNKREGISLYLQVNKRQLGDRAVIEPAGLPASSDWKRRLMIGVMGSLMGLMLGVVVAGVNEYSDQKLSSKEDLRRALGLDVAGALPAVDSKKLRTVLRRAANGHRESASADGHTDELLRPALAELACAVAQRTQAGDMQGAMNGLAVLVTSVHGGEGKTTVATGLATYLSRLGFGRVLLVDAHFAAPALHSFFNAGKTATARDILAGLPWPQLDPAPSAALEPTVLTAGEKADEHLLLHTDAVSAFLKAARSRYHWIIIDGGSIRGGSVTTLARQVDGAVLVVEAERTRRQVVRDALRQLPLDPRQFMLAVLNRQRFYIPRFLYDRL